MIEPIYVKGVRILSPNEYDIYVANIDKPYHRTQFEINFWSGMRYVEFQRFYNHPEWHMKERRTIHLPVSAVHKAKRTALERYIYPIPPQIEGVLMYFHNGRKPPVNKVCNDNYKRWAIKSGFDPKGFSTKMTRKTIESWMIAAGVPMNVVCLRQGHDTLTSMNHYQGLPFSDSEKDEIERRLAGWLI
jgi:hypothetical protein